MANQQVPQRRAHPGDPATPDRDDQATAHATVTIDPGRCSRHAGRAAARATAIAVGSAAAVYAERGTIAKSLAAWHPNRLGDPKLMAVTPPPAALAFTPSPFDFGQVGTGQTSSPQTFTLANTGGQATGALTDTLTGAAAFTVTGDTCTGISLAAGGTCTVTVRFAPASMATDTATLTAASANPAVTATDTLTGTGVRPRFLYWTDQIGSGSGTISVIPLTGVGTPPPWSPGSPPRPGWRLTPAISTGPPPPRGSPRP